MSSSGGGVGVGWGTVLMSLTCVQIVAWKLRIFSNEKNCMKYGMRNELRLNFELSLK